jgi:hypothetical protein
MELIKTDFDIEERIRSVGDLEGFNEVVWARQPARSRPGNGFGPTAGRL